LSLEFSPTWRFAPPADNLFQNVAIPAEATRDFFALIGKISTQGDRQEILEHFKKHFCHVTGVTHVRSSNASWAESDLGDHMNKAAETAPLFIEGLWDACRTLGEINPDYSAPNETVINEVLLKHNVGYAISPPKLFLRENEAAVIVVPAPPPTFTETARNLLVDSIKRCDRLLADGHGREAVQEGLWLLETVTTAFRKTDSGALRIEGKYFNQIVKELRRLRGGTALEQILAWMTTLHGYLSSPTGGGIRHGLDINDGIAISQNEAKLYCNLIRSYLGFLLDEYERLFHDGGPT
jgi:hypothetical protein